MIFKNKKKYSLKDIEELFLRSPIIFILFLASLLMIISYFILESKENRKVDLLKQKYILQEEFKNKELLNVFINKVGKDVKQNFNEVERILRKANYKSLGYIESNFFKKSWLIKEYLESIEKKENIEFVIFRKDDLHIIYGEESIDYLQNLIFSSTKTKILENITLQYIYSQGSNNLQYWKDDTKETIRLSFFEKITLNKVDYFIGTFSTINSIKKITKESIIKSINGSTSHIWFYDLITQDTYNFMNKRKYESSHILLKDNKYDNSYKLIKYYFNDYEYNDAFKNFSYFYYKYNFLVNVYADKNIVNLALSGSISKIHLEYQNLFLQILFYIFVITSILLFSTALFSKFLRTIFNEYNDEFEARNISLEHWKKRFELAIIASNDGLWDINFKTKKIYFSSAWLNMFGYKKGEVEKFSSWFKLIHNEDKKNVELLFEKIFAKKSTSIICEYRLQTKNNGFKWVLARGKVFFDSEGNLDRMLMMSMDIDKNKRMKKELLDIELLVEDGKIVIFKLFNDENLSVKYISNSIKSFGFYKKDFENKDINFIDLIYKDDVSIVKAAIKAVLKNDLKDLTFVCRSLNASNEIRWISCRSIPIKNHSGEVSFFYGYINDITKIKVSQEELKLQVKEEVDKNRQKDRILIQQSKLAAMGEMLGSIAHQWRQPLNNVSLIIQFLRDNYRNEDVSTSKLEKFMNKANYHIEYMSDTIDDFRNFYKPSKTQNEFSLKLCVDSLLYMVKTQFENENIKIDFEFEDVLIINYENELKQSILNILNNAKDALLLKKKNTKFDALISIKIKKDIFKEEKTVKLIISNNGGNIKEDIIDKIFEPYFTTKFESQGTGIGLYMTKSIIETNMKGKIEVQNINASVEFILTFNI